MSAIKVSMTGVPETAAPIDHRYGVEVDEALIRSDSWHAIDLSAAGRSGRAFPGIAARFGYQARVSDEPLPPAVADAPACSAATTLAEAAAPEAEFIESTAPVRRLSRIVRKPYVPAPEAPEAVLPDVEADSACAAPRQASPMPVHQGVAWQQLRLGMRPAKPTLDRGGLKLAIAMMVMAWVAVVTIGAYVSITPKSGTKIEWR